MGNYVELHFDKRRGLDIDDVGKESLILWNGPSVQLADRLGINSFNRRFKSTHWNFVTLESTVTKRLMQKKESLSGWF